MTPDTMDLMARMAKMLAGAPQEDGPHTPGEWTAHTGKVAVAGRAEFYPITAGGVIVGRAWESRSCRHGKANARLMAASPQLLLALQLTQEALELAMTTTTDANELAKLQIAYHRNREAIRRARG